jgi:hypothetical protein
MLMNKIKFAPALIALLIAIVAVACENNQDFSHPCMIPATVQDLTGLDGCGFVFELEDGTRLIPVWELGWCGTPPLPESVTSDPLYNFEYVDGKKVLIGYTLQNDIASVCMAGKTVKITCLKETSGSSF